MCHLICFGLGFTARAFALRQAADGWRISGTSRTREGAQRIEELGEKFSGFVFDGSNQEGVDSPELQSGVEAISAAITDATHILISIPPNEEGDPVLRMFGEAIAAAPQLKWIGYLSTIGVYGDQRGEWVDEDTPVAPRSVRAKRRVEAENAWLRFSDEISQGRPGAQDTTKSVPTVQLFRLAGIYGPGRSPLHNLQRGTARRIVKPGQVFNRTHVRDIAAVLAAAASGKGQHRIYNVADDEPAPPQDVICYAADLLGVEPPPEIHFETADLSDMARSFYGETKRVRIDRIKNDLGVDLAYPTYREGLRAVFDAERT